MEYTDGSVQRLQSDDKGWKVTAQGPIRANNEYDGEEYDARMEMMGWSEVGFDDSKWMKAERTDIPQAVLRGQVTEGMKVLQTLKARSIQKTDSSYIVDLGQNIAGWLRVKLSGKSGDTIRMVFAEKLDNDGRLYRENLRTAYATDYYICNGEEGNGRWWNPTFVYHGFRYAEIFGLKKATKDDFEGQLVADEMRQTGHFECSDTIVNKVMKNAWWASSTITRACLLTVLSATSASLGWAIGLWEVWVSRFSSTTSVSIPSGCAISARLSVLTAVSPTSLPRSGITIATMLPGPLFCLSLAICCGDSLATSSQSSTATPQSRSGCSI